MRHFNRWILLLAALCLLAKQLLCNPLPYQLGDLDDEALSEDRDVVYQTSNNAKRHLNAFAEPMQNTRKLNAMSMMRALINLRRY